MLTRDEAVDFEGTLRRAGWRGVRGRLFYGMYELFPVACERLPVEVERWLLFHGFQLREDPVEGPYWQRPLADDEGRERRWSLRDEAAPV